MEERVSVSWLTTELQHTSYSYHICQKMQLKSCLWLQLGKSGRSKWLWVELNEFMNEWMNGKCWPLQQHMWLSDWPSNWGKLLQSTETLNSACLCNCGQCTLAMFFSTFFVLRKLEYNGNSFCRCWSFFFFDSCWWWWWWQRMKFNCHSTFFCVIQLWWHQVKE